jgi:hypothetical protein
MARLSDMLAALLLTSACLVTEGSPRGEGQGGDRERDQDEASEGFVPCLAAFTFLALGEQLVLLRGDVQRLESRGAPTSGGAPAGQPEREPRASSQLTLSGYQGEAALLWNDLAVQRTTLDPGFMISGQTRVLSHRDPDGTQVELHLFARPACPPTPPDVVSREELALIEQ